MDKVKTRSFTNITHQFRTLLTVIIGMTDQLGTGSWTAKISTKMMIRIKNKSKEWYAEDVGMVRSETYNKRGKLMGYSELTKIESK